MDQDKNVTHSAEGITVDFPMQATTASIQRDLESTDDIDIFLKKNQKNMIPHNLPLHLDMLLKKKGLRRADVARGSLLDRKYVYQIFSGEKTPSRDKLLAMAFGLHLSENEAQTMLKLSGNRELYVKDERDAIILYALQRNKSIFEVNDILYDYDLEILGAPKE